MTTQEFSNEFDVLYNNVMSNQAPGLDEYEKSVFLTKAQSEILKNYFNPKGNKYQEGFDNSIKRQIDFSMLIKTIKPDNYSDSSYIKMDSRSQLFDFSTVTKLLFVINETAIITNSLTNEQKRINIHPLSYLEYSRLMMKPYKAPLKYEGWRLLGQSISGDKSIAEIIVSLDTNCTLNDYMIRYITKPSPIVVSNLSEEYDNVSVEGVKELTECKLDTEIHSEIVQRAVELAKASYNGGLNELLSIGTRTE